MTDKPIFNARYEQNQAYLNKLMGLYRETMLEGRELEQRAEQLRLDAELAYADVGDMKAEGRARVRVTVGRMLPDSGATADYRTNQYKVVGDAKGDVVLWLSWAEGYAALAQMKYAKAAALMAEALVWQSGA